MVKVTGQLQDMFFAQEVSPGVYVVHNPLPSPSMFCALCGNGLTDITLARPQTEETIFLHQECLEAYINKRKWRQEKEQQINDYLEARTNGGTDEGSSGE